MKNHELDLGKRFMRTALGLLFAGLVFGCLAALVYIIPGFGKEKLGFISLRPFHVSAVLFWILMGGTACIYYGLQYLNPGRIIQPLAKIQYALWIVALAGITWSYAHGDFGGREYWEFNPVWALPIGLSWLILIFQFFRVTLKIKDWPVYMWMWMTGILFFIFTFLEGYLWTIPYFREALITDMTVQWKVNGSMVGSWNQIIYGTAMFLMDKISGKTNVGKSRLAFAMYFLGFFNLCFNWGHHIYTLPTEPYVRHIGYMVSLTEWIFFIRILQNWRTDMEEIRTHYAYFPYRFFMAANFWVFLNLFLALIMSVPAFNVYTHGTHITVAHAMGTTIGINSMILLGAASMILRDGTGTELKATKSINFLFWTTQISLLVFWLSLIGAGIAKGHWQMSDTRLSYGEMMIHLKPWFITLFVAGLSLTIALSGIIFFLFNPRIKRTN